MGLPFALPGRIGFRRAMRGLLVAVAAALAGCAQFGVPAVPPEYAEPPWHGDAIYIAYQPHTVLGFGHTAVIVPSDEDDLWWRFDHMSSAEVRYIERLGDGSARLWEALTARVPSVLGLTREVILVERGPDPARLMHGGELLLPLPELDVNAVRAAAEQRFAQAPEPEQGGAPRYFALFNNSHHFTRDVLRAGGEIHDRYFPKHFVQDYLERPSPR